MRPETVTSGPTGVKRFTTAGTGSSGEWTDVDVETVDRIDAVDAAGWDAAVEAQQLPVFYSRTFLAAYEQCRLTAIDACVYLVLRRRGDQGPPVAVLPAYLQSRPDPLGVLASSYPETGGQPALLSHVWHCYDTHLGDPGAAAATISALRRAARELGAPWCGVVNIRQGGRAAAALAGAGLPARYLVDRFNADLDGCADLDQFLQHRARPRARANVRRHHRRAAEHGVTSEVVPVDRADLAAVAAFCRGSATRHGSDEYYPPGRFERFLAALGPVARIIEVRQHGELVAAGVCLLDDTRLHCWAGGANYEVDGNFSPYYVMFGNAIDLAARLGRPVFEGGRGNPVFKARIGLNPRPLLGCVVPA